MERLPGDLVRGRRDLEVAVFQLADGGRVATADAHAVRLAIQEVAEATEGDRVVSGALVLIGGTRDRRRLESHERELRTVCSAMSSDWIAALVKPSARMPRLPGIVWIDPVTKRFVPAWLSLEPGRRRLADRT